MPKLRKPAAPGPRGPEKGRVVKPAPTTVDDTLRVVIPGFDDRHVYEIEPGAWMPHGTDLPPVGAKALVVHDDDGDPWVTMWREG